MAIPITLVAVTVALVILVSVVGRARSLVPPVTSTRTIDQDLTTTVDALSDVYALNELLSLKRKALEATDIPPHRMASLMRDVQNKIDALEHSGSETHDGDDPRDGSIWK
ncbi:hypothetical protein J4H86_03810 [Spiractinospora alimapuensis]|uniref:hypothetical protein n=1 Tax=Spiractinospora alimapuensis TaxID=2820884 RepID=UPI001F3386BA|nr:hypothetical protein [Spiractinospora alimapuensis]QVQ52951.1 hypothetical protein J4H86_03810 [Spiractinospora alimapuensis]